MANRYKPPADPRGGHVRLYWDLIDSCAWRCLTATDQRVYVALTRALGKTNNGDLALTIAMAKPHGISSETTLAKSLRALTAVGLIAITRAGGSQKDGQRLPTLYRVTDRETYPNPVKFIEASKATNEWKAIATTAQGEEAIRLVEVDAKAKADAKKTKSALQNLESTPPENGVVKAKTTPKNGGWAVRPLQKMEEAANVKSAAKPRPARVSAK